MSQIVKLQCTGCGSEFIGFHSMRCMVCRCMAFSSGAEALGEKRMAAGVPHTRAC